MDEVEIKWSLHGKTILKGIKKSFMAQSFTDCTLKAGGGEIKAHRMILSASSPFFQSFFETKDELIFEDMTFEELRLLVDYIYNGEIIVDKRKAERMVELKRKFKLRIEETKSTKSNLSDFSSQKSTFSTRNVSFEDITSILLSRSCSGEKCWSQSSKLEDTTKPENLSNDIKKSKSNSSEDSQTIKHRSLESFLTSKNSFSETSDSIETKMKEMASILLSSTYERMNEARFFSEIPSDCSKKTSSSMILRSTFSQSEAIKIPLTIPSLEDDDRPEECEPIIDLHFSDMKSSTNSNVKVVSSPTILEATKNVIGKEMEVKF